MSDVLEYKCPACGGVLEFDSALQKMKCPYCEMVYEVAQVENATQKEPQQQQPQQNNWNVPNNAWAAGEADHMTIFTCNSCGGEIVGDENTAASECPFCGNQVVMSGRFSGALKPDYIIPFKLDKKEAKNRYLQHISGKYLLPKTFKNDNHIDEIKGVYVPFWIYDANIYSAANFTAENVVHWSDKNYNYTKTSIYDLRRAGTMQFTRIPCDGSTKMDDDLMESIEPFDFSDAVPFQSAYLAGYFADKYDVDQFESQSRANERILNSAIEVLQDTARDQYTSVQKKDNAYMNLLKGDIKYALYPVWLLTSTYGGQKYTFAMNGQTGKFVGNLPIDKKKKNLTAAGIFAGVTAIASVIAYLFM